MDPVPASASACGQTMQNIILVGFMGSGKSSIGRSLHQNLGYELIDTDRAIEKQAGKTIPQIFAEDGENAFRSLETNLLRELVASKISKHIISTGGGMVCTPENRELLRQLGFVVWLKCSTEEIFARTSKSNDRPLLQCEDPVQAIEHLLKERSPHYEKTAHLQIDTTGLSLDEVSCGILESARYYFGSA